MTKIINKIGVELEGGWNLCPDRLGSDGSVRGLERSRYIGELRSEPMTLTPLKEWIRRSYPTEVNSTCGFHIHISTGNLLYYGMMVKKEFTERFLREAKEFGLSINAPSRFFDRVNGSNEFCSGAYRPDLQIRDTGRGSHRRAPFNYCYRLHGTMECRLFPMFDTADDACKAVDFLVRYVREWIASEVRKDRHVEEKLAPLVLDDEKNDYLLHGERGLVCALS